MTNEPGGVIVRRAKNGDVVLTGAGQQALVFTRDEFDALIQGVKAGEFDDLVDPVPADSQAEPA